MDRMKKIKRPKAKSEDRTPGRTKQKGTGGKSTSRPKREAPGSDSKTRKAMQLPGRRVPRAGKAGKRDVD